MCKELEPTAASVPIRSSNSIFKSRKLVGNGYPVMHYCPTSKSTTNRLSLSRLDQTNFISKGKKSHQWNYTTKTQPDWKETSFIQVPDLPHVQIWISNAKRFLIQNLHTQPDDILRLSWDDPDPATSPTCNAFLHVFELLHQTSSKADISISNWLQTTTHIIRMITNKFTSTILTK